MAWPLIIGAALGAGTGLIQGRANQKRAEQDDAFRRAAIMYSPWTGMQDPGPSQAGGGMITSALSGGMRGAAMGQALGAGGATPPVDPSTMAVTGTQAALAPTMNLGAEAASAGAQTMNLDPMSMDVARASGDQAYQQLLKKQYMQSLQQNPYAMLANYGGGGY